MGVEIERKFLLIDESWRAKTSRSERMRQGYLQRDQGQAIRIRITGEQADINIKSTEDGLHRLEYEYPIPLADAEEMLDRVALRPFIDKTRHLLEYAGLVWEIDEFHAENQGLIVAEVELDHVDQAFSKPSWAGEEVTHDRRYFNSNLVVHPYCQW